MLTTQDNGQAVPRLAIINHKAHKYVREIFRKEPQ